MFNEVPNPENIEVSIRSVGKTLSRTGQSFAMSRRVGIGQGISRAVNGKGAKAEIPKKKDDEQKQIVSQEVTEITEERKKKSLRPPRAPVKKALSDYSSGIGGVVSPVLTTR